ncbi:MAG: nitrous oxide reductase accessory protein NosL [Candidatus Thiodiazotropha endolucinida]
MWFRSLLLAVMLAVVFLLIGCSGDSGSGPLAIKWDRDACERCRMVLSDRSHSAQIRYFPPHKQRSAVARFDDIGCAVLWLSEKPWQQDPRTEIWVTDYRTGEWIDATRAIYVKGHHTPMEYGLGAQTEAAPDGLNFAQAKEHIRSVEQQNQIHTAHLLQRLKEQEARRAPDKSKDADRGGD